MKSAFLYAIFFFCFIFLSSFKGKTPWVKGTLYTTNGEEINGEIFYDLESDAVKLRTEKEEFIAYTPHNLERFEYRDKKREVKKTFVALPYKHSGKAFYEVFLETPNVALLIKRDYFWTKESTPYSNYPAGYVNNSAMRTQTEEVFIVDPNGSLHFYMVNTIGQYGIPTGWRNINRNLIEEITGDKFPLVKEYVKKNNLLFIEIEDLTQILNYYSSLLEDGE